MTAAFVFPGQGSQRPGMGEPWVADRGWSLVERAGDVLGRDLERLLLDADDEELRSTQNAQVSTYLVSLLAWQAVLPQDVAVVAGHSLGELTALVAGGVLTSHDGLDLVVARGKAMLAATEAAPGAMAAVLGLADAEVERVCAGIEQVWPANFNAPEHVVISGTVAGVEAASAACREAGARRVLPLPVGGAFHTPLMAPARKTLDVAVASVPYARPEVPVLSAVDVRAYRDDPRSAATTLSRQLTAPVRWRQVLEALPAYGVDTVVELGPGGVLTGLVKRTLPGLRAVSVATPADAEQLRR